MAARGAGEELSDCTARFQLSDCQLGVGELKQGADYGWPGGALRRSFWTPGRDQNRFDGPPLCGNFTRKLSREHLRCTARASLNRSRSDFMRERGDAMRFEQLVRSYTTMCCAMAYNSCIRGGRARRLQEVLAGKVCPNLRSSVRLQLQHVLVPDRSELWLTRSEAQIRKGRSRVDDTGPGDRTGFSSCCEQRATASATAGDEPRSSLADTEIPGAAHAWERGGFRYISISMGMRIAIDRDGVRRYRGSRGKNLSFSGATAVRCVARAGILCHDVPRRLYVILSLLP